MCPLGSNSKKKKTPTKFQVAITNYLHSSATNLPTFGKKSYNMSPKSLSTRNITDFSNVTKVKGFIYHLNLSKLALCKFKSFWPRNLLNHTKKTHNVYTISKSNNVAQMYFLISYYFSVLRIKCIFIKGRKISLSSQNTMLSVNI